MYKSFFKRFFDIVFSFLGLIIVTPIFLLIWLFLAIVNKGAGAFFIQERPGKDERIFRVIKFKTMTDEKDASGNLLPDAQRLTKVGKFVRSTSFDEIPQLLNVIKGDMSLIGPRPLLVSYLPYYTNDERLRHTVRPGITGLAQVNGRNAVNWDQRLALDFFYVNNLSFQLDLAIFFRTIKNVLLREDLVVDPESIMKNLDEERRL